MDESVDKGMELLDLNDGDEIIPQRSDIGRVSVSGFDSGLCRDDVRSALRKHFSSCGKIKHILFPSRCYQREPRISKRYANMYFVGEGAVDKALQLNGTDVGGWIVSVKDWPLPEYDFTFAKVMVSGYDTSLNEIDNRSLLSQHFSSCGKITKVTIVKRFAELVIEGDGAGEKAMKLSGSDMGGCKIVAFQMNPPGTLYYRDGAPGGKPINIFAD